MKIRGLGRTKSPSPEKGDFPGLECREAQTEGSPAGIQTGQVKDPDLGGEPQAGLNRAAEMNSAPALPLNLPLPKARVNSRPGS